VQKILVFNWKMNPGTAREADKIFQTVKNLNRQRQTKLVVAPPFLYLERLAKKGVTLSAQDVFYEEGGAHTGEVSAKMLKAAGVEYVIVGHSERRRLGDSDETVNKKIKAALAAGLKVILAVGERLNVPTHKAGDFVLGQLERDLREIHFSRNNLMIAYEPVWAIGTGRNASVGHASGVAEKIKKVYNSPVLYGGSVNSANIAEYLGDKRISGALVGGASLKRAEVRKMVEELNN